MYNVIFESDNGEKYAFGKNGSTVFDMDFGNGVSVDLGTSQGVSQIGETVQGKTVSGRTINVNGVVYGNVPERKKAMRKVLSPFSSGRLIFNNEYYTKVHIKDAPSFSPVKNDGRFSMRFFAPFPFFYDVKSVSSEIGTIRPLFSFPVNYSTHKFGEKSAARYINIINSGDVKTPFSLFVTTTGTSSDITITNLATFEFLKINGTLNAGETINVYRDEENILHAELISNGNTTDIISRIDEESNLFELQVGDNLLSASDNRGGESLTAKITFKPAVVALYES